MELFAYPLLPLVLLLFQTTGEDMCYQTTYLSPLPAMNYVIARINTVGTEPEVEAGRKIRHPKKAERRLQIHH